VVGGSSAALWGGQSGVRDALIDLRERFDLVNAALTSDADLILGADPAPTMDAKRLGGIETEIRSLARTRPLRVAEVALPPSGFVRAPTAAESLRIKAVLALWYNRTRDYVELAVLGYRFGVDAAAKILAGIDEYYTDPARGGTVVAGQLARQLADPMPADAEQTQRLSVDPTVPAQWRDWDRVRNLCGKLAAMMIESDAEPTGRAWSAEELDTAIRHGDLTQWRQIVVELEADPWGATARRLEKLLGKTYSFGMSKLLGTVLRRARDRVEHAERDQIAADVRAAIARSGMSQAEFASRIGTSQSRLSTYQTGKVIPSAAMMLRIRRVGTDEE
jgi:DNA-binding transcriptional regulator YiaG